MHIKNLFLLSVCLVETICFSQTISHDVIREEFIRTAAKQLVKYIPNHGMKNSIPSAFEPQLYEIMQHAFAIPTNAVGAVGSDEWLYYFVSGNGDCICEEHPVTIYEVKKTSNQGAILKLNYMHHDHVITLKLINGNWVIADFDNVKYKLCEYIDEMRVYFRSSKWNLYILDLYNDVEYCQSARNKQIEVQEYFNRYPLSDNESKSIQPAITEKQREEEFYRLTKIKEDEEVRRKAQIAAERKKQEERNAALSSLRKEKDEVEGITYYYNSYFTHINSSVGSLSLFIKMEEYKDPKLMLKVSHYTNDASFHFNEIILSANDKRINIPIARVKTDSEMRGSFLFFDWYYSTWMENEVTTPVLNFMRTIKLEDKVILRIKSSNKQFDFLFSENEKKALLQVLQGYEALI